MVCRLFLHIYYISQMHFLQVRCLKKQTYIQIDV